MPVTIIYHADCLDGFGSAYAAWVRFGGSANFRPLHHGDTVLLSEIAGHDVYILDFSFSEQTLREMAHRANSVTQIDHHASASAAWGTQLEQNEDGSKSYRASDQSLRLFFDLNKSGARLAWEHFNPHMPVPLALRHIEDQDLWRFEMPGSRAFCRSIRLLPFEFPIWETLIRAADCIDAPAYLEAICKGEVIEEFLQHEVSRLAGGRSSIAATLRGQPVDVLQARRHGQKTVSDGNMTWLAIPGIAVNASALFASELGHRLAEQSGTFGLVWQLSGKREVNVSLRSTGTFDVGEIATRYGGGGHRNASGFRIPLSEFASEIIGTTEYLLSH